MSIDMQQYSLANQLDAIEKYATKHRFNIVRTYSDAGRSGLVLAGREALKGLINDIVSGCADFKFVLVYDVSRWGRFQDCDESAHYEYLCRESGVEVIYCTEQFNNDGSIQTSIIKNLKRAMAGEYSRELSARTFFGQCRIAALGFHATSTPGYGLRRFLIDSRGNRKGELRSGEWKSIRTDRIVLVPGPRKEVATVREIFRLFVDEKKSLRAIAQHLNSRGSVNAHGRPWQSQGVRHVLLSERYIGNSVYNRISCKLKKHIVRNPPHEWIRKENAFESIVTEEMFRRAQKQFRENRVVYSPQELISALTKVWREKGKLSAELLAATKGVPSLGVYQRCFGSLSNAYRLIGFQNSIVGHRADSLNHRKFVCEEILRDGVLHARSISPLQIRGHLQINGELTLAVEVAIFHGTSAALGSGGSSTTDNVGRISFWLFAWMRQTNPSRITLSFRS